MLFYNYPAAAVRYFFAAAAHFFLNSAIKPCGTAAYLL